MWYPEIETAWNRGISAAQNADRVGDEPHRRARREDELLLGLVLLEDVVLERPAEPRALDAGLARAAATYIASSTAAGALIVIDVVTAPRSIPA